MPLSVLGGIGNGYANVGASTLLVTRTPDAEPGRVSAAATAAVGGAQGVSLLAGGAVVAVLSPREIYALAADCSEWASRSPSPSSTPPGRPEPASACSPGPKNRSAADLGRPHLVGGTSRSRTWLEGRSTA